MTLKHIQSSFPINEKIILIGNEPAKGDNPNKLIIGKVVDHQSVNNDSAFVVYKDDDSGEEYMTFSKPMYYSEELKSALLKLTWDERWNIFSGGLSILKKEDKERKEEYTKDSE